MRWRHGVFDVSDASSPSTTPARPYVKRPIPRPAVVTHSSAMPHRLPLSPRSFVSRLLSGLVLVALPGIAAAEPRARLVHCGSDTCLRLTGTRVHPAVQVRIAGRDIPVEGARSWQVTMPLAATRGLVDASGQTLTITLADPRTGTQQTQAAMLPPGALGRPVELASLTIYAH